MKKGTFMKYIDIRGVSTVITTKVKYIFLDLSLMSIVYVSKKKISSR